MNRILWIVFFSFYAFGAPAQVSFTQQQDSIMQYLDKQRITSGALYDRVFPWAELMSYTDSQQVDYKDVRQAWYELYLATYNRANLKSVDDLTVLIQNNQSDTDFVTVGYIDFTFNYVDSLAFTTGALIFDTTTNRWYDGNSQLNPYGTKEIVMPLIATQHLKDGWNHFYFDPNAVLINGSNKNIKEISLDIGGIQIDLKPGDKKSVNLGMLNPGSRIGRVRVEFTGIAPRFFPYLFDVGMIGVMSSVTTDLCRDNNPIGRWSGSDLTFQGYDELEATQGFGEFMTFYKLQELSEAGCVKKITRPIIFIDGFDPEDLRKIHEEHEEGGVIYDPIWEFLSYEENKHLGDELRLMGYDIIVLNFPTYKDEVITEGIYRDGGADYIERNAMVLTSLIQYVNEQLDLNVANPAEREIIIAGPSMGGQISRYALAYMEQQHLLNPSLDKWNHRCRLWISFDSPHHGANIPIGLQQFMYYFGHSYNDLSAKENYDHKIRSVAARQMLIHQMDGLNGTSSYFSTYYSNLAGNGLAGSGGYPQNVRKVSLVNGMGNGSMVGTPGGNALRLNADANIMGIPLDAFKIILKDTEANTTPVKTLDVYALKPSSPPLRFGYGYYHETTTSSIPTTNMSSQSKLINIGLPMGLLPFHVRIQLFEADYFSANTSAYGALDVMQGGQHDGIKELHNTLLDKLEDMSSIDNIITVNSAKSRTFIPTISALGFSNPAMDWSAPIDDRDIVCTEEIPFDNYLFASAKNMDHVDLDAKSAKWIKEEIMYGTDGCPNICATKMTNTLAGRYMCGTDEYIFSLNSLVPASVGTVQWEFSAGLQLLTHPTVNNNSIKLKWDGITTPENQYVKVKIVPKIAGEQCGASKEFVANIHYGDPFQLVHNFTGVGDPTFTVRVEPNSVMDYTYKWRDDAADPWPATNTTFWSREFTKVPLHTAKYYSVRVYAEGCTSHVAELTGQYVSIGMGMDDGTGATTSFQELFNVSNPTLIPNPTTTEWKLVLPLDWERNQSVATVYAADGRKMYSVNVGKAEYTTLSTDNLSSGVYIIEVISGTKRAVIKGVKK